MMELEYILEFCLGFFLANLIGMNGMTGTLAALGFLAAIGFAVYKVTKYFADNEPVYFD